jgi:dihydrofolate reductase
MRRLVSFMHISLDGFATEAKGSMDWITVDNEMFDYSGMQTDRSDTALYGHGTYDIMQAYWPTAADKPDASKHDIEHSRWYKDVEKIVISKSLKGKTLSNARIVCDDVANEILKLKKASGKDIVMFGSPTLTLSLLQENLIDDYWLFLNPILLGQGKNIFNGLRKILKLKLVESKAFASGVVCLHYAVSS